MNAHRHDGPLVAALTDPSITVALTAREWHDLLMAARAQALLARLATELVERDLFARAPGKARSQMHRATIAAESTHTAIRFEANRVLRALENVDTPIVLLKGSAYVMAGLPAGRGRFVGDLDFMVPREKIDEVERALIGGGWVAAEMDAYDQRYYREWIHEIPPLQHPDRETPLDVHHTIVPLTARVHPDAAAMFATSVPLADSRLRVLGPADMVLHSAVHLFNDEVGRPLRDLFDLHDLLCQFDAREGFWNELIDRARLHGLGRPCYYTLRYTHRLLGTSIPSETRQAAAAWAPSPLLLVLMDWIFMQRFMPESLEQSRPGAAFARWLYYVRTHWLRMPPLMLARHLSVKAKRRLGERWERKPKEVEA